MANNAAYYNNIRHILECVHVSPLVITDPIGYETSEEEFTRTIKNVGIISNFSTDLKFVDDGLDFVENIALNYGLNETITIRKEGQDPNTDEWIELYTSTLDLMTYKIENNELSVKINSGGFDKIFKSRESEKLEVESTTTIDGVTIPELNTKDLEIQGRNIFLKSIFNVSENDDKVRMYNYVKNGTAGKIEALPLEIVDNSHRFAQNVTPYTEKNDSSSTGNVAGDLGWMFFANSDRERTLDIDLDISFVVNILRFSNVTWSEFSLRFAIYKDGSEFNFDRQIPIWETSSINSFDGQTKNFSYSDTITINAGESISLQFRQRVNENDGFLEFEVARLEVECADIVCDLTIEEDSSFPSTNTKVLLLHDLGERLSQLITGKSNRFKSSVLGRTEIGYANDGDWAYLGTYSGHWLRNFVDSDNLYKKYTTSFKDFTQTLKSILNIHVGFQSIGFEEDVIAEEFEYFFNPNIVLVLPNPLTNVKRYVADDFIFSSVTGGYEKGGEIEGIMGLDEPNGKANWVSNMTALKNNYSILSKYIAGVYDEEKQRRFQKNDYPTEDTDRDKDIFIKDLKNDNGTLKERIWQDDFAVAPTGIFSPETTKNLRLSPANNLRRHGKLLATPLEHYQNESLAFGSSTANSNMTTQLIGGSAIVENGNILNSNLGNRLFEPFYIEGEHLVDTAIMNTLKDFSNFNGVQVSNFYCKVQFTIENDPTLRYGYIMSVKPNGAGKWKFIEASSVTPPQP